MERRHLTHLLLAPLYLGFATLFVALFSRASPAGAALAGFSAAGLAVLPAAVVIAGMARGSRKLVRFSLLVVTAEVITMGILFSPGRRTDYGVLTLDPEKTRARLRLGSGDAYEAVLKHARGIAALGPRHTGTPGLDKTLQYVRGELARCGWTQPATGEMSSAAQPPPERAVRAIFCPVLTPVDEGSSLQLSGAEQALPAYALLPNAVQPCATPPEGLRAPLVYLGQGRDDELDGHAIAGKIAVFEFASANRWLWAYEHGAAAAVFLGESGGTETVRQADHKFLALLPLNFPRVYIAASDPGAAAQVRDAARAEHEALLHSRMTLKTLQTPILEALIPGAQSTREMLVMAHADARAIAPALSFGGQEVFGLGTWLALFEYFAARPPPFSLRFVLTTGHWQAQAPGRAYAYALKEALGGQIAMAIGVDLNPETDALILTDETFGDCVRPQYYWWLKKLLFTADKRAPAWMDQIEALSERPVADRGATPSRYAFYGGRPTVAGSQWSLWLAPLDKWPPVSHSACHPTANQALSQSGGVSVAFQTCDGYRHRHFTCTDTIEPWLPKAGNLKPQLELTFALIGALSDLDPARCPVNHAYPHHELGGYNRAEVQALCWNPGILWYDKKPPAERRTVAMLVPGDSRYLRGSKAYWPRPMAPSRYLHRQLQCLQTVYMAEVDENGRAVFPNVYCPTVFTAYDALTFSLDSSGRITHAFDQGFHGDAEFHFLDRGIGGERTLFQVPSFECGAIVLASLLDRDRVNVGRIVENEYRMQWANGNEQDDGEAPYLPVHTVNEAATHTTADSHAWVQFRDTAMVFLKPGQRCEMLAGSLQQKTALFNDDPELRAQLTRRAGEEGVSLPELLARLDVESARIGRSVVGASVPPRSLSKRAETPAPLPSAPQGAVYVGFRVAAGEERRIQQTTRASLEQVANITRKRMSDYGALNVRSPMVELYQARADAHEAEAVRERAAGKTTAADAADALAWSGQSIAYRSAYHLLLDVVTTTIFYFLLLLPFGYLVERLLFPQLTLFRSAVVVAIVFTVFSTLLYAFHPGFHLASNVFVTVVTFVIVILTLPALFLTVGRGLALAMEPGARFKRRHSADTERWGVLGAALSLAVNNMRRRSLRTGLTLATVTLLVTSLVLLTSTTADTEFFRDKQSHPQARYRGVQVLNTRDHTHGMSEAAAEILRARYRARAHVIQRRYFCPGHEQSMPCYARAGGTPGGAEKRFMVRGAIAIDPGEAKVSRLDSAIAAGRFFAEDDLHACLLSTEVAQKHKLALGDTVRMLGVELELVGLLRDTSVDGGIVDISGRPITPLAFYRPSLSVDQPDHLLAAEAIFLPSALLEKKAPAPFPVFTVVIAPHAPGDSEIAQRVLELQSWRDAAARDDLGTPVERILDAAGGALEPPEAERLSSAHGEEVLVQLAAYNLERLAIQQIAREIAADHINVDVFLTHPAAPWESAAKDRVELLSAFDQVSLKSGSFLVLPFLISFFMLLAIMIGNVYERRAEIQVFSSVGLAPRHVAGMFLAEALVYAGIASVLGYFIGIILLDVFRRGGWLPPNFHPNYFGKVVIWSALLATTSALLSVVYPMLIASRMVNPSLERVWRIESAPRGDDWVISLPFVAGSRSEVIGILQFASEFLSHHRGERSGAFAIEDDPLLMLRPPSSGGAREAVPVLCGMTWLSPFERDLVQRIALVPRLDAEKKRYRFELEATRVSGPGYLWQKSTHAFVDGLRKQMLIWRSLGEELVEEYIESGHAALGERPPNASGPHKGEARHERT